MRVSIIFLAFIMGDYVVESLSKAESDICTNKN